MEDFFDLDSARAFVFLLSENDNKNKIYISEEKLLVIRNNKRRVFDLNDLAELRSETKKMLFPLLLGGIITPFAFLSFFINLYLPWIHLISVLGGLLLFYIGWAGKKTLTVVFKNRDEVNFYLPSLSKNVEAFIEFVNGSFKQDHDSSHGNMIFFEVDEEFIDTFFGKTSKGANRLFPVLGYTFSQVKQSGKSIQKLIAIDPLKAGSEIKFTYDLQTNQMRPLTVKSLLPESQIVIGESGWKL